MFPSKNRSENQREHNRYLATVIPFAFALFLVLAAPSDGFGQSQGQETDKDSVGAPYAAGELLVTYTEEPEASSEDEQVREEVSAGVEEEVAKLDAQLLVFPEIKEERSENAREENLKRKKAALEEDSRVEHVDYNYVRKTLNRPKDPEFSRQWGLRKAGFPRAWERTKGRGVDIAILDGGIDARHPDLRDKIVAQRDFMDEDGVAEDSSFGHGTHVAGIAAASTDNGEGIAGGCPGCGILVGKVVEYGEGYDSDIAEGIVWTVDEGAEVVNLSLGAPVQSNLLKEAIAYAKSKDVLVVAAAGNFAPFGNPKIYPAAYPDAMAVAATNVKDERDSYSSYGNWVDVAAPGVRIYSTLSEGKYGYDSGTSMAAPHVSALAGMLIAEGLQSTKARTKIESTAVDLGKRGKDPRFGHGRIDAAAAISTLLPDRGRRCTIEGSKGANVLLGTEGRDVICGRGGNDVVDGRGGNDVLYGDAGYDVLKGGSGNDRLVGSAGNDVLKGGSGFDRLLGGSGRDVLNARDGLKGELVDGGSGRDVCAVDPDEEVKRCP